MKLWIDDVRPAPERYVWAKSTNETIRFITEFENLVEIEILDVDHDSGDYFWDGGDYIKLLDWLEETGRSYPIHIHSMNPVGVANMRAIIKRNGWTERVRVNECSS